MAAATPGAQSVTRLPTDAAALGAVSPCRRTVASHGDRVTAGRTSQTRAGMRRKVPEVSAHHWHKLGLEEYLSQATA